MRQGYYSSHPGAIGNGPGTIATVLGNVDARKIAEFNSNMALETENIRLKPEVILAGATRLINDDALGYYLVAEADGQIVGSLMVTTEWSDWRNGP